MTAHHDANRRLESVAFSSLCDEPPIDGDGLAGHEAGLVRAQPHDRISDRVAREPGRVRWLLGSLLLSVILTVVMNVGLRAFPTAGRRLARRVLERPSPLGDGDDDYVRHNRVRVIVPWRAMIIASVVLTIVINLVWWLSRS